MLKNYGASGEIGIHKGLKIPRRKPYRFESGLAHQLEWCNVLMIVFDLGCDNDHRFEGWFSSSEDFDRQQKDKLLSCPLCGSTHISRLLTAARLNTGRATAPASEQQEPAAGSAQYANFDGARMMRLISHIVESTEDVGKAFPEEARKIHYRESPERHIRGTASPQEVDDLRDEGIDVVALPVPGNLAGKAH